MKLLYCLICLLPWLVVVSHKIDTDGIWRNIAFGIISFGGFIAAISGSASLICIGVLAFLVEKIVFHYSPLCKKIHKFRPDNKHKAQ